MLVPLYHHLLISRYDPEEDWRVWSEEFVDTNEGNARSNSQDSTMIARNHSFLDAASNTRNVIYFQKVQFLQIFHYILVIYFLIGLIKIFFFFLHHAQIIYLPLGQMIILLRAVAISRCVYTYIHIDDDAQISATRHMRNRSRKFGITSFLFFQNRIYQIFTSEQLPTLLLFTEIINRMIGNHIKL